MGKMDGRERQKKTQFSDSLNMKMSSVAYSLRANSKIEVFFVNFVGNIKSNDLASAISHHSYNLY